MGSKNFAYDRLGQFIRPGANKLAWLAANGKNILNPDKGDLRLGAAGCVILITEGDCTVVSSARPNLEEGCDHIKTMSSAQMGKKYGKPSGFRPFLLDSIFNPPEGMFLLFELSKAGFPGDNLILNMNGRVIYSSDPKSITVTKNAVIREAFDKLALGEIDPKRVRELKRAFAVCDMRYTQKPMAKKDIADFEALVTGTAINKAHALLFQHESLPQFYEYLYFMSECGGVQ